MKKEASLRTPWLTRHLVCATVALALLTSQCGARDEAVIDPEDIESRAEALLTSRCSLSASGVSCSRRELALTALLVPRTVSYELPLGTAPKDGWPVVLFFQGSFFPAALAFSADKSSRFGQYHLALTVKALLDAGYAVLAPNALLDGTAFWQTNVPPWSLLWNTSSDHAFLMAIWKAIHDGKFGSLDAGRMYAMGISSGGFMTSRMAVSYPGTFRALAIHSGSYATCSALCLVPSLPSDHPPTLFLHGALDLLVSVPAMESYRDALRRAGHEEKTIIDRGAGHEWIPDGQRVIPEWFAAHR
jgi:dienelactone hydrolase